MSSAVQNQWITLQAGMEGYLALPPAGSGPGLLLFQEIFGVNAHIRAVADQYALDGFVVLAPDLFWRQAPQVELGYVGEDRQRAFALMQAYGQDEALADIRLSAQVLRARPELAAEAGRPMRMGAIGYCMGGRMAYLAAAEAGVDASVAFYGGGIHLQLDKAPRIRCPMQFHYAEQDEHIPPAALEAVRSAFAGRMGEQHPQAPGSTQIHVYPGSQHGFNCWARASYHAPSAALAHGRALGFLAQTLWA